MLSHVSYMHIQASVAAKNAVARVSFERELGNKDPQLHTVKNIYEEGRVQKEERREEQVRVNQGEWLDGEQEGGGNRDRSGKRAKIEPLLGRQLEQYWDDFGSDGRSEARRP